MNWKFLYKKYKIVIKENGMCSLKLLSRINRNLNQNGRRLLNNPILRMRRVIYLFLMMKIRMWKNLERVLKMKMQGAFIVMDFSLKT